MLTNLIAALVMAAGYFLHQPILFSVGLFALSGAITNWLAVHMLFEKVPGLYGSGVIPARFEAFKIAIFKLMMEQFFTAENIDRFLSDKSGAATHVDLQPVIEKVDLSSSFDALLQTVEQSSFGSMLGMFGGTEALLPLREPFIEKMKVSLVDIAQSDEFAELVRNQLEQPDMISGTREKIEAIVSQRLDELTPQLVKEIVQQMIKQHLGWLVIWGGVFGGVIGLVAALVQA